MNERPGMECDGAEEFVHHGSDESVVCHVDVACWNFCVVLASSRQHSQLVPNCSPVPATSALGLHIHPAYLSTCTCTRSTVRRDLDLPVLRSRLARSR